ncbi:MerR family transcriptional regulator [Dankookia sp. GCM10030260]|uniref:MerR family transcriptional regulator n=1 Tax=Dankookia sp. GCM10030260 TaxID=3273390 RepID=UPI0036D2F916
MPGADAAAPDPAPDTNSKQIPAAAFATLVGRSLRTLRSWDEAGLTHPEMRNSRRYYGAADLVAVLALGTSRKGPREGSSIKYLTAVWDNGT